MAKIVQLCVIVGLLFGVKADEDTNFELDMTFDELIQNLESFGSDCEPKPTEEVLREIVLNIEDAQRETKCFRRCLLEHFNMHQSGSPKMHVDNVLDMLSMVYEDERDNLRVIIEKCNKENEHLTDNCEAAHGQAMCLFREFKANGYAVPQYKE